MSAISSLLSSANNFRAPGAAIPSGLQTQRGAASSTGAVRGGNTANTSSAYCPTCGGGANSARSSSGASSYCPTCNTAGGRQSNITSFNNTAQRSSTPAAANRAGGATHNHQSGQICVGCAYNR